MASLFFWRAKGSVSTWLLPLPLDKVRPGSSPPVFTDDMTKVWYWLSITFQTQGRRAAHWFPCNIHNLLGCRMFKTSFIKRYLWSLQKFNIYTSEEISASSIKWYHLRMQCMRKLCSFFISNTNFHWAKVLLEKCKCAPLLLHRFIRHRYLREDQSMWQTVV